MKHQAKQIKLPAAKPMTDVHTGDEAVQEQITNLIDARSKNNWQAVDLALTRLIKLGKLTSPPLSPQALSELRTCLTNTETMFKVARLTLGAERAHVINLSLTTIRQNIS